MTIRDSYPIIIKDPLAIIRGLRASILVQLNDTEIETNEQAAAFDAMHDQLVFNPLNKGLDVGDGIITTDCILLYGSYIYALLMSRVTFDPDTHEAYDDKDQPWYVFTVRMLSDETTEEVEVMSENAVLCGPMLPDWTMLVIR